MIKLQVIQMFKSNFLTKFFGLSKLIKTTP